MPEPTVGETGAVKAGAETAQPSKSASPATGADGAGKESKGVEERIAQLTGEIGRKDEKVAKLEKQLAELAEKAKTDDEKRLEQLVEAKFGPRLKRADDLEAYLGTQLDGLLKQIPAEHAGLVMRGEHIPVEQQITQAQHALSLLQQKGSLPAFKTGGNPGSQEKQVHTKAAYDRWANSVYSDRKYFDEHKEEMQSAVREGRVEGLR